MPFSNKANRAYTLQFGGTAGSGSPTWADGATFYIGAPGSGATVAASSGYGTVDGYYSVFAPITGTITAFSFSMDTPSANSTSNEAGTLYVRIGTTDTSIATDVIFSNSSGTGYVKTGAISIAVTAGQEIRFKVVCPTWATNPTNSYYFVGSMVVEY